MSFFGSAPDIGAHEYTSVIPSEAAAYAAAIEPTVEIAGPPGIEVTPPGAAASGVLVAPSVVLGAVTATPSSATVVAALAAPSIVIDLPVVPSSAITNAALVVPGVGLSSLGVTPSSATVNAPAVAPGVLPNLEDVLISPPDAIAIAAYAVPGVTYGSLSVTPPCVVAAAGVGDPFPIFPDRAVVEVVADGTCVVAWPLIDPSAAEAVAVAPSVSLGNVLASKPIAAVEAGFSPPMVTWAWPEPVPVPAEAAVVAPTVFYGSVVAVILSAAEQHELITNGSFETDTSGWIGSGGTSLSRSPDQQVDGDYSMYCEKDGENIGAYQYITADIPPGTVVTFSAWVYPVTDCRIRLVMYDTTHGVQQEYWLVDGGAWTQISITKTLGAGGSSRYLKVETELTHSNFYVDSVHLGAAHGAAVISESTVVAPGVAYGSTTIAPSVAAAEAGIRPHELWPPWVSEGRGDPFSVLTGAG